MEKLKDWEGNLEKTQIEYDVLDFTSHSDEHVFCKSIDSDTPILSPNSDKNDFIIKADKTDCLLAVGSGILTGLLDVFWVGGFNIQESQRWGREQSDRFVIFVARSQGYESTDLKGSIQYLEKKYINPSDKLTSQFGGPTLHHINDFSHHPSLIGLFFSILTQFTRHAHGINREGKYISIPLPDNAVTGKNFIEKISFGLFHWFFHLVSDMSGSSNNPGKGTGIPGPLLSFAKSVSSLKIVRELSIKYKDDYVQFSLYISKIFTGSIIPCEDGQDRIRFDMRTEIGVSAFLGKQSIPVLINHALIRSFYLIKHLYTEIRNNHINSLPMFRLLDPVHFLPYTNDCTIRMTTISTSVFTAIDSGDATVRAALHCGFNSVAFAACIVFRLNILGIASLAITIRNDIRNTFFRTDTAHITGDMIDFNVDVRIEMNNNELYEYTFNRLLARLTNRRNAYMNQQKSRQEEAPLVQIANSDYYTYSDLISISETNIKTALFEMFERLLSINDISYEKVPYHISFTINNTSYQRQKPSFKTILYLNEEKILCVFIIKKTDYVNDDTISKAINENVNKILIVSFVDPKVGSFSYDYVHKDLSNDCIIINRITLRDLFDLCFGKDEFVIFLKYLNEFNNLAKRVTGYSVIRLPEKDSLHVYGDDDVIVDISFDEFYSWIDNAFVFGLSSQIRSSIEKVKFSLTHNNDIHWDLSYFIEPSDIEERTDDLSFLSPHNTINWLSELNPNDIYLNVLNIIKKYLSGDSRGAIILKQYSITYSFIDYETGTVKETSIT